jgi:hypothetical protein
MHFTDECSDENAPFKILTLTKKKLLLNLNAWNGSSHLWTPPCDFLKNIEMKMTLVKILIRSELLQKTYLKVAYTMYQCHIKHFSFLLILYFCQHFVNIYFCLNHL